MSRTAGPEATFASQQVFKKPSGYVKHLIEQLPAEKRLTRDQLLFMARFAVCCDEAWEDEAASGASGPPSLVVGRGRLR